MTKNRLEAFSDGVLAIIITIMILEIKVPKDSSLTSLQPLIPVFLSYILSFVYVGIYWNNHHHLLHTVKKVNASIMWSNLFLLFWLSLIPFGTSWIGSQRFGMIPTFTYGLILLMCAVSYLLLQKSIIKQQGDESILARVLQKDYKGKISVAFHIVALPLAFVSPLISEILFIAVAVLWVIPDKRIEKHIN